MPRTEQPTSTTAPTTHVAITAAKSDRPSSTARKGLLAGAVFFTACAAACSLPLLLAGGAAISAGALFSGADAIIAAAALATIALISALLWVRRRAQNTSDACGCGGTCGC